MIRNLHRFQKKLPALLLLIALSLGFEIHAQTSSASPQVVCAGYSGPYRVDFTENGGAGTTGSNYTWSVITAGFSGTITPNQGPGSSSNRVLINWGTTPIGTYQLQVIETNNGCTSTAVLLSIQILPNVTPSFGAIGPLCQNSVPPALPSTSANGITGNWSPAVISTAAIGTTTYTFTPNAGQCATVVTTNITITILLTPTFSPVDALCQNSTPPVLPLTSLNGITGTWSPAVISTATVGTTTYTFTPNAGQCAGNTTLNITTVLQAIPTFTAVGPFCQNAVAASLPLTSLNGVTGSWSPSTISTSSTGNSTYTFTPAAGQCASPFLLNVSVIALPSTSPIFHD